MPSTKLEAKIVATDQFSSTFKKAESTIKGFGNRLKKPFGELGASIFNLRNAVAAFGTVIGVRFAARLVTGIADSADQIGKLSERVGVSTEQLSILRFAAEQTGSDFNTLATAIRTATQRIGEFAGTGKGQAAQALQALGIAEAVKDGEQLEELLPRIADAFQRIDNQAERVNLASKLFGETGGPAFLNLLQQGSRGLAQFRAEAEKLGIVIHADQAKNAADFNDEMNRLKATFTGFTQEALSPLLPVLASFVEELRGILADMRTAREERSQALQDLAKLRGVGKASTLGGPRRPQGFVDPFTGRPGGGTGAPEGLAFGPGVDLGKDLRAGPFPGDEKTAENIRETTVATGEFKFAIEGVVKAVGDAGNLVTGFSAGIDELRKQFSGFNVAANAAVSAGNAVAGTIASNLSALIERTKTAKQAFSDLAKSIINDLQRIIIQALAARAVGIALGGGGGLSGTSFTTASGGTVSGTQFVTHGGLGPAPGTASFQHGGFVPAGVTQKAVLHGPEVVVPLGRKFGPQIGAGAGGGNTTIINITAIDVEDFDRKMLGSMRRNDSAVTGLVANSARSSAGLRGAFR